MNSLRLMGFALKPRTKHYHIVEQELWFASQQNKTLISALGQNPTYVHVRAMSGLTPITDIV